MTYDRLAAETASDKNLFDFDMSEETRQRILSLRSDSQRLWGKMTVAQTLAHCTAGVGVINPKRARFPVSVLGLLIKPLVLGKGTPMRRNSPSSPELFTADPAECDFEKERSRLIEAVGRFSNEGTAGCTEHPHPFFGRLKPRQWAVLMYKHIDHHLRQFGA